MTDPTPRDRALGGEVVKVTDERLAEMQHIATSDTVQHPNSTRWHWLAVFTELIAARKEIEHLTGRLAELEKERDACAEDARAMQERLQRAVNGATKLRETLNRITDIRPLGIDTYEECFRSMRALALEALSDYGPPSPKHPPRVPGHNPVG